MEDKKEIKGRAKFFLVNMAIVVGIAILFFIFFKLSNVIYKQRSTNSEISVLQEEIERLEKNSYDFEELINYFQMDQFKEKEAKDKLNLVKEGEKVVFLKEKEIIKEEKQPEQKPEITVNRPNYYWWWHYFFGI